MTTNTNFTKFEMGAIEELINQKFDGIQGKLFIGQKLGLTGSEASITCLPANTGVPFVNNHQKNEELYIILKGTGTFYIDGEEFPVREGSLIRIAPNSARSCKAGNQNLYFICIQAQEHSLTQATLQDGSICDVKASWMK